MSCPDDFKQLLKTLYFKKETFSCLISQKYKNFKCGLMKRLLTEKKKLKFYLTNSLFIVCKYQKSIRVKY